ncbi:MAG: PQQ-binding-like beta-propeller repeat protein [Acidobacteriota bacterium]|nr:MAG: PQQ-binding-like beta-propeller repeat protein [Acidobacteriota bacterium]
MRYFNVAFACVAAGLALSCLGCGTPAPAPVVREWLTQQYDLAGTGVSPGPGPRQLTHIVWELETGGAIWSGAVVTEERVFFGNQHSQFVAVERASGTLVWNNDLGPGAVIRRMPTLYEGTLYVAAQHGHLFALDAESGEIRWTFLSEDAHHDHPGKMAFSASPRVKDGLVYAPCMDGKLYVIDASSGEEVWKFSNSAGQGIAAAPAIRDSMLYLGTMARTDTLLMALDVTERKLVWQAELPAHVMSSPAVDEARVYAAAGNGGIYAFDAKGGEKLWTFTAEYAVFSFPAVDDARVYYGSRDGYVYALDKFTGELAWKFDAEGYVESGLVRAGPLLYVGSSDGNVHALDAETGEEVARFTARNAVQSTLAVYDETLYFGDMSGYFYAVADQAQ